MHDTAYFHSKVRSIPTITIFSKKYNRPLLDVELTPESIGGVYLSSKRSLTRLRTYERNPQRVSGQPCRSLSSDQTVNQSTETGLQHAALTVTAVSCAVRARAQ